MNQAAVRMNLAKKAVLAAFAVAAIMSPLLAGFVASHEAFAQAQTGAAASSADEIAQRLAEQQQPRKVVPFDPKQFDKYVGYYQFGANTFLTVTRSDDHFFSQLTGQQKVEIYPESPTKFFLTVVAAQLSFTTDAQGKVTEAVLHQNGLEQHVRKVDEATAKAGETALADRIKNKIPSPGTEASLRRYIDSLEKGQPNYDEMTPALANLVRRQLPTIEDRIKKWGALKSIAFVEVSQQGWDTYDVTFEHGRAEWWIAPLTPDGKAGGRGFNPIP